MKAKDVKIGGEYEARIAGGTVQVRILAEKASGGWTAQNLDTKKKVFVPLARQLREPDTNATTTVDGNITVVEAAPATVETIDGLTKPARTRKTKAQEDSDRETAKLSQLDAAVKVLGDATEPLTTKEMVEAMAAKSLWTSPGGKTPHATLYSAILRELQSKGNASRFVKTDRGHFQLRSA